MNPIRIKGFPASHFPATPELTLEFLTGILYTWRTAEGAVIQLTAGLLEGDEVRK